MTRKLIRGLNERFGAKNVSFLFIIRNHISFIESAYAQFLKGGLFRVADTEFEYRIRKVFGTNSIVYLDKIVSH